MPRLKGGQAPKRISDEDKAKMYDLVMVHGKSMVQVGQEMGVTRDTVSRAVRQYEKLQDQDRPVDTEDLVKLERDIYKKLNELIHGLTATALEKSNAYQIAGAISYLAAVLKDLTKATKGNLEDDLAEDVDIRAQMGRLEDGLKKLSKLSGRLNQEKVRDAERISADEGRAAAEA